MPASRSKNDVNSEPLPPLAAEDHTCVDCALAYSEVRTEDRPAMEPMFNDLRARRFRYNGCDFEATLDELAAAATGFCEQVARIEQGDWDRVVHRVSRPVAGKSGAHDHTVGRQQVGLHVAEEVTAVRAPVCGLHDGRVCPLAADGLSVTVGVEIAEALPI